MKRATVNIMWTILIVGLSMQIAWALDATPSKVYTENDLNIVVSRTTSLFTIQLKSNPSTGFSWFLREYDSNLITPLKHSFVKATNNLLGAPGYEIWTFKAKLSGFIVPTQTTLRFVYTRPWQGIDGSSGVIFRVSFVDQLPPKVQQ